MSTYLTRLAARASGRATGATLAPRPAPHLSAAGPIEAGWEPTAAEVEREPASEPGRGHRVARRVDQEPGARAARAAEAVLPEQPPGAVAAAPGEPELPDELLRCEDPAQVSTAQTAVRHSASPNAVAQADPVRPQAQTPGRPWDRQSADETAGADEAELMVELRPRPAAAATVGSRPRTRREEAPPPRIEVRIGRVEVRRPRPAPSPARRAPSPPARDPFAGLAAARRYVDRVWS